MDLQLCLQINQHKINNQILLTLMNILSKKNKIIIKSNIPLKNYNNFFNKITVNPNKNIQYIFPVL